MGKDSIEGAVPYALFAGEAWFDLIECGIRGRIRALIEELVKQEVASALGRARYERGGTSGHRHGHPRPARCHLHRAESRFPVSRVLTPDMLDASCGPKGRSPLSLH